MFQDPAQAVSGRVGKVAPARSGGYDGPRIRALLKSQRLIGVLHPKVLPNAQAEKWSDRFARFDNAPEDKVKALSELQELYGRYAPRAVDELGVHPGFTLAAEATAKGMPAEAARRIALGASLAFEDIDKPDSAKASLRERTIRSLTRSPIYQGMHRTARIMAANGLQARRTKGMVDALVNASVLSGDPDLAHTVLDFSFEAYRVPGGGFMTIGKSASRRAITPRLDALFLDLQRHAQETGQPLPPLTFAPWRVGEHSGFLAVDATSGRALMRDGYPAITGMQHAIHRMGDPNLPPQTLLQKHDPWERNTGPEITLLSASQDGVGPKMADLEGMPQVAMAPAVPMAPVYPPVALPQQYDMDPVAKALGRVFDQILENLNPEEYSWNFTPELPLPPTEDSKPENDGAPHLALSEGTKWYQIQNILRGALEGGQGVPLDGSPDGSEVDLPPLEGTPMPEPDRDSAIAGGGYVPVEIDPSLPPTPMPEQTKPEVEGIPIEEQDKDSYTLLIKNMKGKLLAMLPTWYKQLYMREEPSEDERSSEFATRICNDYGDEERGPGSSYNIIRKWANLLKARKRQGK